MTITSSRRRERSNRHIARLSGVRGGDPCRKVRASEIPVLALEDPASDARNQLRAEVRRALDEDGGESVVLGCADTVDLARSLCEELAGPVVEGVTAAVKIVEGLAVLGVTTSKRGAMPRPDRRRTRVRSRDTVPRDGWASGVLTAYLVPARANGTHPCGARLSGRR